MAADLIQGAATDATFLSMFVRMLDRGLTEALALDTFAPVDLSLGVYASIHQAEPAARPLAVACTLAYLGIDALDDALDGDSSAKWGAFTSRELVLLGTAALATFPSLALSQAAALSPARRLRALHALAEGLLAAADGERQDIAEVVQTPDQAVSLAAAKSGSEWAAFAEAAAALAGAGAKARKGYAAFGRELGTAGQLASDCQDIWGEGWSRDLAAGRCTLPVAYWLHTASSADRADIERLRVAARQEAKAQDELRNQLRSSGALFYAALVIENHRQLALGHLPNRHPRLERLAASVRLFPGEDSGPGV